MGNGLKGLVGIIFGKWPAVLMILCEWGIHKIMPYARTLRQLNKTNRRKKGEKESLFALFLCSVFCGARGNMSNYYVEDLGGFIQ